MDNISYSDNITCYALCLQKKTKEVLSLIVAHYQSLENDVRAQIQLEHEVEQEKIRKVSKRFPRWHGLYTIQRSEPAKNPYSRHAIIHNREALAMFLDSALLSGTRPPLNA